MFSKIKKYIIGFFVLAGGILFAFLSGKSAGRKKELLGGLKDKIKDTDKSIKQTKSKQKNIKKSLKSKKKTLEEIKKQRESFGVHERTSSKDAADFLKKYANKREK
jgi:septal ring factor EnvC (AmiA/AmiB activator)|tara:strand:- start:1211 stop:1528 length:318 start_codon:yes stop_codon:yes gene_type:complete